jgi:SAM-dependent methyltransferase
MAAAPSSPSGGWSTGRSLRASGERTGVWTRANLRHLAALIVQGRNPAARVYESIGSDFLLAPAPGWLNLGLWEGDGTEEEAPQAVRRLVEVIASRLPRGGVVLDVGNGLGVQDPVIAEVAAPNRLIVLNITESQLRVGKEPLATAEARPVVGDAVRIPLAAETVDGVISVEAAFHFRSRRAFFEEVRRVLKPGGVLTMSDVSTERLPRSPQELLAGLTQLRVWGLNMEAAATTEAIAGTASAAGLVEVKVERRGERVIEPALALTRRRLERQDVPLPASQRLAIRILLAQVELLWRRRMIDYLLLWAKKPGSARMG